MTTETITTSGEEVLCKSLQQVQTEMVENKIAELCKSLQVKDIISNKALYFEIAAYDEKNMPAAITFVMGDDIPDISIPLEIGIEEFLEMVEGISEI